MHKKYLKILLVILVVFLISGFLGFQIEGARAASALEALITGNMELASGGLPLTQNPTQIVKLVIQGALGLVAIIFFVIIVIAGFRWMTGGGNEESITKAKKMITNATIGLIVVMFSYAITVFVFDVILGANK